MRNYLNLNDYVRNVEIRSFSRERVELTDRSKSPPYRSKIRVSSARQVARKLEIGMMRQKSSSSSRQRHNHKKSRKLKIDRNQQRSRSLSSDYWNPQKARKLKVHRKNSKSSSESQQRKPQRRLQIRRKSSSGQSEDYSKKHQIRMNKHQKKIKRRNQSSSDVSSTEKKKFYLQYKKLKQSEMGQNSSSSESENSNKQAPKSNSAVSESCASENRAEYEEKLFELYEDIKKRKKSIERERQNKKWKEYQQKKGKMQKVQSSEKQIIKMKYDEEQAVNLKLKKNKKVEKSSSQSQPKYKSWKRQGFQEEDQYQEEVKFQEKNLVLEKKGSILDKIEPKSLSLQEIKQLKVSRRNNSDDNNGIMLFKTESQFSNLNSAAIYGERFRQKEQQMEIEDIKQQKSKKIDNNKQQPKNKNTKIPIESLQQNFQKVEKIKQVNKNQVQDNMIQENSKQIPNKQSENNEQNKMKKKKKVWALEPTPAVQRQSSFKVIDHRAIKKQEEEISSLEKKLVIKEVIYNENVKPTQKPDYLTSSDPSLSLSSSKNQKKPPNTNGIIYQSQGGSPQSQQNSDDIHQQNPFSYAPSQQLLLPPPQLIYPHQPQFYHPNSANSAQGDIQQDPLIATQLQVHNQQMEDLIIQQTAIITQQQLQLNQLQQQKQESQNEYQKQFKPSNNKILSSQSSQKQPQIIAQDKPNISKNAIRKLEVSKQSITPIVDDSQMVRKLEIKKLKKDESEEQIQQYKQDYQDRSVRHNGKLTLVRRK